MSDLSELAKAVRSERKRRRWSQKLLAAEAGVSLGVVNNFERGTTVPQPANLTSILEVLDLSADGVDPVPRDTNERDWPPDVDVFLDVVGLFLKGLPDDARSLVIRDLTRYVMTYPKG